MHQSGIKKGVEQYLKWCIEKGIFFFFAFSYNNVRSVKRQICFLSLPEVKPGVDAARATVNSPDRMFQFLESVVTDF